MKFYEWAGAAFGLGEGGLYLAKYPEARRILSLRYWVKERPY